MSRASPLPWLLLIGSLNAAETIITPDEQPGAKPLAAAIERASAGDTLVLKPGVYRERVRVEKPLTLRAQPGAVLDGSVPFQAEWVPAGAELPGVWVAPVKKRPFGLLVDGRFIAEIRLDRAQKAGDWHWRTLLAKGPPLSGFAEIRALWLHHADEQRIYARFADGASPAAMKLAILPSSEPLLTIAGAQGVTVEGLGFAAGTTAVLLTDGAREAVIRGCKVGSYESTGIIIGKGATRCTVTGCEVTRGALEEWQPSLEHSRANYEIWRIHKDVGRYDRVGIELYQAGAGNKVLHNRLDRVFDGICIADYKTESLDKPLTDPDHGRESEIAHNEITNTRDSGIELGTGCIEVDVHHNTLRRTHGGLRFKVPRIGPVFIHHNRLIDGAPFNIWFSMDAAPAVGFIYHNTLIGGDSAALVCSSFNTKRDFAAPKWQVLNNLVLSKEGFFDQYGSAPPADFTAAHNVTTGARQPWPKDMARDPGSRYEIAVPHDENGRPAAGSAAIDAGLDLSTRFEGRPLPACPPGYFKGRAPDAGADEVE